MDSKTRSTWVALLAAVAFVAAACGTAETNTGVAESDAGDTVGESTNDTAAEPATDEADGGEVYESSDEATAEGSETTAAAAVAEGDLDLSAPVQVSGETELALDFDSYTFAGLQGQQVSARIDSFNDGRCSDDDLWMLQVEVLDPDGESVGSPGYGFISGCEAFGPWTLPEDGQYTFKIGGTDGAAYELPLFGAYEATLAALRLEPRPVDLSAPVQVGGEIEIAHDAHLYQFDGEEGQQVSVTIDSFNGGCSDSDMWMLQVEVVDSDGEGLGSPGYGFISGCDAFGPWPLPEAGQYAVKIGGTDGSAYDLPFTGSYEATLGIVGG
jgi:hypothetical protein